MPNRHRIRATTLAATAAVLVSFPLIGRATAPTAASPPPSTLNLSSQTLNWKDCPAPSASEGGGSAPVPLPTGGRWQCATMKTPLNWNDPKGATIGIALIRVKASGPPEQRIGSLIFNFGGPGGSGVSTLPSFAPDYTTLGTRYDLVSFDPRGVGRSAGVICENNQQLDTYFQQDAVPSTAAEQQTYLNAIRQFNHACEVNAGRLLPYLRTTDAARDMDLMRQVLGDARLHYFGISYGTELGGVYAHLFPQNVGRMVLDAVVDPTQSPAESALGQAKGFQRALEDYARNCVAQSAGCPVGSTAQDVQNRIVALLKSLDSKPLPGLPPRVLTRTAATSGIAQALYSKAFWTYLTVGLQQAYAGDGKVLMLLADAMNGRNESGQYNNLMSANVSINCADQRARYTVADVKAKLPQFRAASPVFGDFLAWGMLSCTDWPVAGAAAHADVSAPGSAPILVVGNTGDPATPYEGTRRMVQALGPGVAVELTFKGEGHGSYDSGNACVQDVVNSYLLHGKVPPAGKVCT
ncbi:alpha/beta hydrolase [Streptomyces nodosus]|uniref:alpha/beta hydrolase n=1 Tax=Streptomyces nodosus TaxID=40318 RepID=UPI00382FF0DD